MSRERLAPLGVANYFWVFSKAGKPVISIGFTSGMDTMAGAKMLAPFVDRYTWSEIQAIRRGRDLENGDEVRLYYFLDYCDRDMDYVFPRDMAAIRFRLLMEASRV